MIFFRGFSAEINIGVGRVVGIGAGIYRDINSGFIIIFGIGISSRVGGNVVGEDESDNDGEF